MSATTIRLYELAGVEDDLRFSPYCWRVRLALLHKGQPFETLPWRFTEKDAIAFSGQSKVPVIVDGDRVVYDSWAIAEYLEDTYTDCPSLFGGPSAKAISRCVSSFSLLMSDDLVYAWRERMLDAFGGEARNSVGVPLLTR